MNVPGPGGPITRFFPRVLGAEPHETWLILEIDVSLWLDTNGDGVGDLPGVTQTIPEIAAAGFNAIWLLPLTKAAGRDATYDPIDYNRVHEPYGTVADFEKLCSVAGQYGVAVIDELVMNHTSIHHSWFEASRRRVDPYTDYYIWFDDPSIYAQALQMFPDQEPSVAHWDPVRKQYYFSEFFWHQAALNWGNELVRAEVRKVADFWFARGAVMHRVDAWPHIGKDPGTNCHTRPKIFAWGVELNDWRRSKWPNRALLVEHNGPWHQVRRSLEAGFDACFDLTIHGPVLEALTSGDAAPVNELLGALARREAPPHTTAIKPSGLHDERTFQFYKRSGRHYLWRQDWSSRSNWGAAGRLMDAAGGDFRRYMNILMTYWALPGAKSMWMGDELGMRQAESFPLRVGETVLDQRLRSRTPYPRNGEPGAGFSTVDEEAFTAPLGDGPFGYRAVNLAAQRGQPYVPHTCVVALNHLVREYPDLFFTGRFAHRPQGNPHLACWTLEAPSGALGRDVLLVIDNVSKEEQRYAKELPSDYGKRSATPIHPQVFGGERSPSFTVEAGGVFTTVLGPYEVKYYLLDEPTD